MRVQTSDMAPARPSRRLHRAIGGFAPQVARRGTLRLCSVAIGLIVFAGGCASPRPVLYPNATYERAGQSQVERDIEFCMDRAKAFLGRSDGVMDPRVKEVTTQTARGAVAGAAVGAVAGAVSGDAGQGAKIGAATGATGGFLSGLFRGGSRVDPVYANFVERCLRDKGYEPIGWR